MPGSLVRLQVMSDLHLEVGNQYQSFQVPVQAPFLLLAGDIGRLQDYENYLSFIATQCDNFDMVCLVLGNHEFYGMSRCDGLALAHKLENEDRTRGRLKVLHRRRLEIGSSLCILGCTLQSHIRPSTRIEVERRVKDFKRIQDWTVDQHNEEHERDLDWLRTNIESIRTESKYTGIRKRVVVVTHHAPVRKGSSRPKDENNALADAFATDLVGVDKQLRRVAWWVFGHTHFTTQRREHGIHLISNQRGYVLNTKWDTSQVNDKNIHRFIGVWFKRRQHNFDVRKCIQIRL